MKEITDEIRDLLEDIEFITYLSPALQERLIEGMRMETCLAGQVIFEEREKGDSIYIVSSGRVAIKKSIKRHESRELILDYCEPGDFFGEMAVFEKVARSARAEACEETRLLVIDGATFMEIMNENPESFARLLFSMIRILSNRLRMNHMKLITFYETGNVLSGSQPLPTVCSQILDILLTSFEVGSGAVLIYNPLTQLMEFEALRGVTPANPGLRGLPLTGLLKQVMDKGEPALIDKIFIDGNLKEMIGQDTAVAWLLIAPMKVEQQLAGFLVLIKKEDYTPFNKGELLLISALARQLSHAVMTSRAKEEIAAREQFKRLKQRF
jgi:CRP-like cAMP-binding protein